MSLKRCLGILAICTVFVQPIYAAESHSPRGLAAAAVPNFSYSSGEGWEYGAKFFLYQFGTGTHQPYRWHVEVNAARSTEEKEDYYAFIDMPHIWGENTRFDVRFEYKDFGLDDYYGLGNLPEYYEAWSETHSTAFLVKKYYNYHHRWSAGYINSQWPIVKGTIRLLAGMAAVRTQINTYPLPNKLAAHSPRGVEGGWTNYARIGLVVDRRDQEAAPVSGYWSDLLFEKSTHFLGSDYDYARITATDRRYYEVITRLVYAQRLLIEHMPGDPPFYEMAVVSGSYQRFEGLGSSRSMRGIPRLLFVGRTKVLVNLELRYQAFDMRILRQDLTFYGHLFVDGGKVWRKKDSVNLAHFHYSHGAGIHVQWKKDFIGALDIGRSEYDDLAIYITFGNLF